MSVLDRLSKSIRMFRDDEPLTKEEGIAAQQQFVEGFAAQLETRQNLQTDVKALENALATAPPGSDSADIFEDKLEEKTEALEALNEEIADDIPRMQELTQQYTPELYDPNIDGNVIKGMVLVSDDFGLAEQANIVTLQERMASDNASQYPEPTPEQMQNVRNFAEAVRLAEFTTEFTAENNPEVFSLATQIKVNNTANAAILEHSTKTPEVQVEVTPVEATIETPPSTDVETVVAPAPVIEETVSPKPEVVQPVAPEVSQIDGILSRGDEISGSSDYLRDLDPEEVKEIQRAVGVEPDGKFGEQTMAATEKYMQENGLDQNMTLNQLYADAQENAPFGEAEYDEGLATQYAAAAYKIPDGELSSSQFNVAAAQPAPDTAPKVDLGNDLQNSGMSNPAPQTFTV